MSPPTPTTVWDSGLQPERTTLAWRRLAVTFLGLALAGLKLTWPLLNAWALLPAALVAAGSITLLVGAHRRYVDLCRRLATQAPTLTDGRVILTTAAIALVVSILALVAVTEAGTRV